jgi:hypothetical protein
VTSKNLLPSLVRTRRLSGFANSSCFFHLQCDESHPTCRNCQKSKRECLGYDPIFKSQQGPTAIQPAPNSASPLPVNPAASSPYSHIPPPPYAQQPVLHPYHTSIPAGTPGMADYNNIDPALQGAGGMYNGEDDSRLEGR